LKIRIFTLAKELNLDSKILIGYCQKVGIDLKDSPLASITEEEKVRVLAYMKQGAATESAGKQGDAAPTRESLRTPIGKVPTIRTTAPKPTPPPRESRQETPPEDQAAPAAPVAPAAPEAGAVPPSEKSPAAAAPRKKGKAQPVAEEGVPPLAPSPSESAPAVPAKGAEPGKEVRPAATGEPVEGPMRREDYMPASGTSRTMSSRGNVSRVEPGAPRRPKGRATPQLPRLAEPPPPPRAPAGGGPVAESPAQKPEMRLSRELLEGKPLHEHIRQHAEDKKRKATDEFPEGFADEPKRPGARESRTTTGMGLISERKQRQARRTRGGAEEEEAETPAAMRARQHRARKSRGVQATALKTSAEIEPPINIRSLSEALGRRASELLAVAARKGKMLTINSSLDEETALELALECGVDLVIARERDFEEELLESARSRTGTTEMPRPPIVTILGHVDHGKTTLLDKIRSSNVAAGEQGGITQHIAAYQVEHNGRKITFLDTPGHAAFAEMRARGANVTDVAVLVVAANDGVMPQTIEALNHARAANVPIVVALNKIDLPDRNEQRVLQDLAGQNLLAAEWGGDTEVVRTSGNTGQGIEALLETLLTVAELRELTSDPNRIAHGACLEGFRDEGRGALAWLIVQEGTLHTGDVVLCGGAFGRIRSMYDDHDREIDHAGPSCPVMVAGLDMVPNAGDRFYVLENVEEARQVAQLRRERGREKQLAQRGRVRTLQEILSQGEAGGAQDLPVIIKADTPGSLEALRGEVTKFHHEEVRVMILHEGVGGVNESDVYLASASGAIIVAFHVVPDDRAKSLADREGVEIREYGIIYEVTDDIKKALEGLLKPQVVETPTGRALVLRTFDISRFGRIAGCRVLNGVIERTSRIRLVRDQTVVNEYNIASLKRGKDDAREVQKDMECGIRLENFNDVKEGDILQAFKVEEVKRTL
jgi:translation initiation factor IF-2